MKDFYVLNRKGIEKLQVAGNIATKQIIAEVEQWKTSDAADR